MKNDAMIILRFLELDSAEAGRAAESLRDAILDAQPATEVSLFKEDPTTMDGGTSLLIGFLSAPAIVILARGIAEWLRRRGQNTSIEIEGTKMSLKATGPIDDNAARIVEAFTRAAQKHAPKKE